MNEISKEKIEVGGVEYTLFLNRKGVVALEKFCKENLVEITELQEKYNKLLNETKKVELDDDTDPFEGMENIEDMEKDSQVVSETFKYLYWIMLYTEHKFSISKASEIYEEACKEYGETQLILLGQQMIEDMNKNMVQSTELKNLAALRQKWN